MGARASRPQSRAPILAFPHNRYGEGRNMAGERAYLSESGFSELAGFSGFHFAQLAVFAITGNPAKTNVDERLRIKDEPDES